MTDTEVNKGDSIIVSLNLERLGDNFTYFWTKNGVEFEGNDIVNLTVTSLHIVSADCDDNGLYNVTATNQFGSGSLYFRLTVLCKLRNLFVSFCLLYRSIQVLQYFKILALHRSM